MPSLPDALDVNRLTVSTKPSVRFPRIHCSADISMTIQVIIYERPNPTSMQYLSLNPVSLALGSGAEVPKQTTVFDGLEEAEETDRKRRERLVEKLKLHKIIARPPTERETALPRLIEQVNCSHELNTLLQKNIGILSRRMKRALSVSERMTESANNLWDYVYMALSYVVRVWAWPDHRAASYHLPDHSPCRGRNHPETFALETKFSRIACVEGHIGYGTAD